MKWEALNVIGRRLVPKVEVGRHGVVDAVGGGYYPVEWTEEPYQVVFFFESWHNSLVVSNSVEVRVSE